MDGKIYQQESWKLLAMKNNLKVFIASHKTDLAGPTEALVIYLNKNFSHVFGVLHPLPYCENKSVEFLYQGKLKTINFSYKVPDLFYYIKDVFFNFFYFIKWKTQFEYFIGVDPLNCIVGVILRKLGLVKTLIYYTIDWVPIRFQNKIMNYIYHKIDAICVNNSDLLWCLSQKIVEVRVKQNGNNIILVPVGAYLDSIPARLNVKTDQFKIVLLGALAPSKGVDLVLDAWEEISKKIPNVRLYIIGKSSLGHVEDGIKYLPYEPQFARYSNNIIQLGVLPHRQVLEKLVEMDVGLALYRPNVNNFSAWADPSRVKDYLSCGVPTIVTSVPDISNDIRNFKCGLVIEYDKNDLIDAVLSLYENKKRRIQMQSNAQEYMKRYDWNTIFDNSFRTICE